MSLKQHNQRVYLAALPWCVALGIHGVLLFWPWSKPAPVTSKSTATGRVRVVEQAPTPQKRAAKEPIAIAKTSSSALVVAKQRSPAPPKPQGQPQPSKPTTKPTPPQAAPQSPKTKPPTQATPAKTGKVPQAPISPHDLVVNLAKLPDTQPCQQVDGCWRSQKSQWRSVYAKVHEQITAQGYRVTELELEDDTGFRVSQIAKNGQTKYYLHLLSTLEGTVYILNPTQLSKDEVESRVLHPQQMG